MSFATGTTRALDTGTSAGSAINVRNTAILRDVRFQELVKKRNGLAVTLSVIMLAIYSVFIGLVAFGKPLLATKIAGTTSLGIALGLFVIVAAFVITALYVVRANGRFDTLNDALVREYGP